VEETSLHFLPHPPRAFSAPFLPSHDNPKQNNTHAYSLSLSLSLSLTHTHTQEFPALRRQALIALIATCPERVAPLLAALAFDPQLSFGMRLEVR
jgi:hypothetical protein